MPSRYPIAGRLSLLAILGVAAFGDAPASVVQAQQSPARLFIDAPGQPLPGQSTAPPVVRSGPVTIRYERALCVLEAIPRDMFTRVAAPVALQRKLVEGAPGPASVAITVNYTGFTPQAQAAFQYAVDIWRLQLTSTGPLTVNATFTAEGFSPAELGSAWAAWIVSDFTGALKANTWYPKALANKLSGADVAPDSTPEILAKFNSAITWYFGTDGNTPAGQYDFVSVVLHELGHGLGFYGSASVSSGLGSIRRSGYPDIYDHFVENSAGQSLLTAFTSGTAELAAQLQGNNLHWNGFNGVVAAGGNKPSLYAPATWVSDLSYSHLDETTYPAGNVDSLMTASMGSAEAIHSPGPITRGMFRDMGWTAQATPVIVWANPLAIVYGTALSGTQLNATATADGTTVAGTFVYTPASGTVLGAGPGQPLSAAFAPVDTTLYTAAAKTVMINVWVLTDNPLAAGTTTVKAVHITELRYAIDALRTQHLLSPFSWTDAPLVAGDSPIKAIHLTDLRTALSQVYAVVPAQPAPTYTHPTVTGGSTVVTAVDLAELRAAILAVW